MKPSSMIAIVLCGACCVTLAATDANGQSGKYAPTAAALRSIFSPQLAPVNKTMGLTQRSFIDLVASSRPRLEIAIVVDGTESMGESLAGIHETLEAMVQDLELFKQSDLAFQMVVYRDIGSQLGEVSFPMVAAGKRFTSERQTLKDAVAALKADTGAPYFPELIDQGVHAALTELEWSEDDQTTRWVMLFGDAPPYDLGFEDQETQARRRYDTSYLASIAERKGVQINCILCTSRAEEQTAYESVLDKTRQFMSTLSTETGGLMLDLSYPEIRTALQKAAEQHRVSYSQIGEITELELDQLRAAAEQQRSQLADSRRVQVAVLPLLPMKEMSFDPRKKEVLVATDLREKLRRIPGMDVKSPTAVNRQLQVLLRRDLTDDQLLQALATVLKVDYILWGDMTLDNQVEQYTSTIYDGSTGLKIAEGAGLANVGSPAGDATSQITRGLITNVMRTGDSPRLSNAFASLNDVPGGGNLVLTPVSAVPEAQDDLLAGYDWLEQALELTLGSAQALPILQRAETSLNKAVEVDRDNAMAHLLLANCLFAQAKIHVNQQEAQLADEKMQRFRASLNRANRNIGKLSRNEQRNEVKADYSLFGRQGGVAEAIELYESLARANRTGDDAVTLKTALRAHWMLAGIYSGDWGVPAEFQNAEKAREHLAAILAHWPDSHEAEMIRSDLQWNRETGKNQIESVPRRDEALFTAESQ